MAVEKEKKEGTVIETLPDTKFKVRLDDGKEILEVAGPGTPAPNGGHFTSISDGQSPKLTEDQLVFVGDTLFAGSVGRTDLGGNMTHLIKSIKEKLLILPDETVVYTGHGPQTTITQEKMHNPFLQ